MVFLYLKTSHPISEWRNIPRQKTGKFRNYSSFCFQTFKVLDYLTFVRFTSLSCASAEQIPFIVTTSDKEYWRYPPGMMLCSVSFFILLYKHIFFVICPIYNLQTTAGVDFSS